MSSLGDYLTQSSIVRFAAMMAVVTIIFSICEMVVKGIQTLTRKMW